MDKKILHELYEKIANKLKAAGYDISAMKDISYGIQFAIAYGSKSDCIRIYQNKKGIVSLDYSLIKDTTERSRIINIIDDRFANTNVYPENAKNRIELPNIGTDESGKGDYFGPLAVAGVMLADEKEECELLNSGVKDSKLLTDERICELANEIREIVGKDRYTIVYINPEKYNILYDKISNLNKLLAWGHARALENILSLNTCKVAVADQFGDECYIKNALMKRGKDVMLIQMPKAEQHTAVAAASILAREAFLKQLSILSEKYSISLPKGASQQVEVVAKEIVVNYGQEELRKIAKLHFKTTQRVLSDGK